MKKFRNIILKAKLNLKFTCEFRSFTMGSDRNSGGISILTKNLAK
jgi:hypothetical protein